MIRVSGIGAGASSPRRAAKAGGDFRIEEASSAGARVSAPAAAPAETLGALIALQSDAAGGEQNRARAFAAAQRVLDLLDRLRMGLLDGEIGAEDLNALCLAASARLAPAGDAALGALYDEIALRARVELAKRGR